MTKRTVKVRVAVAVVGVDEWAAYGHSGAEDVDALMTAEDCLRYQPVKLAWLTAELELPDSAEPEEVAADVEEAT